MFMLKISVIVPVYKVEEYLDRCIESIVNQTYRNLEILLIDDGSPDHCPVLCEEWSKRDSRIRVIHQKNGGLSAARNTGILAASGDYIGFIDSDDYILPTMYERMLIALTKNNADLCICGIRWVNEDGSAFQDAVPGSVKNEIMNQNQAFIKLCGEGYCHYVTAVNKLYKKNIFSNLLFPEGRIHEDEFVIHHILQKCTKIVGLEEELYYYVQRQNSITHDAYSIKHLDGAWALYDRYLFFKELGHKELSNYALRQCYGAVILGIQNSDVVREKKTFDPIIKKIVAALGGNVRTAKLLLVYYKNMLRGKAAFIKANLYLRKTFLTKSRSSGMIVLMATPIHGNLGDQAIVYAEYKILHKIFPDKKMVEIPNHIFLRFPELVAQNISENDIIIIDGGGNLGILWPHEDDKIRDIIRLFNENQIVIFPQTCYYDTQKESKERVCKNRKIYENASNLTVMLRDRTSYDFMRKEFPEVKTAFLPDVVLSLKPVRQCIKRKGILLCFREDCEAVIGKQSKEILIEQIKKSGYESKVTSTLVPFCVNRKNRKKELQKKWNEFSGAQLIITDRLHAMIFAVITETPCIAINNKSKKVEGTYEWIKELSYICFLQDGHLDRSLIQKLADTQGNNTFRYPISNINKLFKG